MPQRKAVDAALTEFGREIGIKDCKLNENDCFSLSLDDDVVVNTSFDDANDRLVFLSEIGELPPDPATSSGLRMDVMERALHTNMLGRESLGATLALVPDSATLVVLSKIDDNDVSGHDIARHIERHAAVTQSWINALEEISADNEVNRDMVPASEFIAPDRFA